MKSEVPKTRPNGRLIFVGAVVAVLVLTPVVAVVASGGKRTRRVRAAAPVSASSADVPHKASSGPNDRPLPRARPTVVDPVAGETAIQAAGEGAGVPSDTPPEGGGQDGVSPGAPSDAEVRAELEGIRRAQRQIKKALLSGRFPIAYGTGRLTWPLPRQYKTLSSPFCERRAWESCHPGIDIPAPIGTKIAAADAGTVILAGPTGGYGNYTCIQHTKTLSTCYAHQSRILVRPGDDVQRGQVIGLVGCTGLCFGSHLHFETRNNGQVFDPMTFF